jgi:alkylation response protein AidB-like acyl-CoA dehydrogenase
MQVGLGQAAVDLAVEYAKGRTQFGRAIGSFQALKHLLADAAVGVEVARAAVHAGAVAVDESGDAGGGAGVHAARVVASSAARRATATCIQVHGGMGYTWELDAHLYLKRVLVLDQHPATPDDALEAIAAGW